MALQAQLRNARVELGLVLLGIAGQDEQRHVVACVAHARVGLEQAQEVLARLQRADEQDVAGLQPPRRAHAIHGGRVGRVRGRDAIRNRDHVARVEPRHRAQDVLARVLRDRHDARRAADGPRHEATKGQRIGLGHQLGRKAVRRIVHRHDTWAVEARWQNVVAVVQRGPIGTQPGR